MNFVGNSLQNTVGLTIVNPAQIGVYITLTKVFGCSAKIAILIIMFL
jgi:hypothetical protein